MKSVLVFSLAFFSFAVKAQISAQVGVDLWSATTPPVRYLPNYDTPQKWNTANYYGKLNASHSFDYVDVGLKVRSSTVDGAYIDQASIALQNNGLGIRMGILPFRITWCEKYNFQSVWIREPGSFCSYRGLADGANSAPGAQVFASHVFGSWVVDQQIGVYRESIYSQSKAEGAVFFLSGANVFDRRSGLSLNAMHIPTATQFRLAFLDVSQNIRGEYLSNYRYQTYFAGAEFNPVEQLTVKATALGYFGKQSNPDSGVFNYQAISYVLSFVYKASDKDQLGVGFNQTINQVNYLEYQINQNLRVPVLTLAYRRELDKRFFMSLEYQNASYSYSITEYMNSAGRGDAIGLRLGINL